MPEPLSRRSATVPNCGLDAVSVGDRIRFTPRGSGASWPWLVRARNDRFIVATMQVPFKPKGTRMYTVVDIVGWGFSRNGAGPGIVRSSLDILGGGWGDGSYDDDACQEILDAVTSGEWGLSMRRAIDVWEVEVCP